VSCEQRYALAMEAELVSREGVSDTALNRRGWEDVDPARRRVMRANTR